MVDFGVLPLRVNHGFRFSLGSFFRIGRGISHFIFNFVFVDVAQFLMGFNFRASRQEYFFELTMFLLFFYVSYFVFI